VKIIILLDENEVNVLRVGKYIVYFEKNKYFTVKKINEASKKIFLMYLDI